MFVMSRSAHSAKKRPYPLGDLGRNPQSSKGSTISIMPISSHSSTSSGAGMLWAVRMALAPISFNSSI